MQAVADTRTCARCGHERPFDEFARDASKASGRKSHCKACDRARCRRYYAGSGRERKREYYARNRERRLAYDRQRRASKPLVDRPCSVCGNSFMPSDVRQQQCEPCRRTRYRRRKRHKTADRGYGARHQALRRQWARAVEAGSVFCATCGLLIEPGTPWDLGHDDDDRSRYKGPEHRHCNRATAGASQQAPPRRPQSRRW